MEKQKILILALADVGFDGVSGYMDDGSEEYKRFVVNQENRVFIEGTYSRKTHGGRIKFANIIGKFDPDVRFLLEPIEVPRLDINELREFYPKHYERPYHGDSESLRRTPRMLR